MLGENTRFPYWCHKCQIETFPVANTQGEPSCNFCRESYLEDIASYREDHPYRRESIDRPNPKVARRPMSYEGGPRVTYRIFSNGGPSSGGNVINYTISSPMSMNSVDGTDGISALIGGNPILYLIFGSSASSYQHFYQQHPGDQQFESFLNYIMQNDPNQHGSPPASEKSIKQLGKEKVNESNFNKFEKEECSVCKDKYKIDETTVKMPCGHLFHEDCIMPWLNQHNSCPVCRYELPTEDKDYEERKAQLRRQVSRNLDQAEQSQQPRSHSSQNNVRRGHHIHNEINS